ncbi:voltage-dependent calcium channel subunit alpha-2/delta-4 isoform X3 [Hydra vulgaris]|uniref:Voltage-dependent calcium channel subunit alpha-2/delta-4 isoform X3 n=2 Tax=Hydra vulgaris TaxID=6087 RepID=A0ABM4BQY7_HYDVU
MSVCFCICSFFIFGVFKIQCLPSDQDLISAAKIFSELLLLNTNKVTNYEALDKDFNAIFKDPDIRRRNLKNLTDDFKTRVENFFFQKEKIIRKLTNTTSYLEENYNYDPNINYPNVPNVHDIDSSPNASIVAFDPSYPAKIEINLTKSFVQVPTNIYAGSVDILNAVKRTENLDVVFKENREEDSSLILQYYGDSTGLFRMFPGNLNGYIKDDPNYIDLYDCRRRVWYQISSASPKDAVIILDVSGSMIGNNIAIAKIAAKTLIDTLEENDYFNMMTVSKTAKFILNDENKNEIKKLMQATRFNKERMKLAINNIDEPKDILDISKAISRAFESLKDNTTYTAGCNKVIMIISDGIEGDYSSTAGNVFDKMNADKSVRVFSYLVGRVKNPDDRALKEMSCNNRGYFYKIETIGNVWDVVVEYLKVLSRPLAANSVKIKPKISPIYLDSSGAGMVLTMSMGVFNKNNLSGVVGVDMLINSLKKKVSFKELGYLSHAIIINNNGFIILHPKFRDQTGYLSASANVYFEDLEYSVDKNNSIALKIKMLNRNSGNMSFSSYWLYDDNNRIALHNFTYFFYPINNTILSLALAISDYEINYVAVNQQKVTEDIIQNGLNALNEFVNFSCGHQYFTYVQIAALMFCNICNETRYPTASQVYSCLSSKSLDTVKNECSHDLFNNLITTAGIAHKRILESLDKCSDEKSDEIFFRSLYVGTNGGYTRFFSRNQSVPPELDSLRTSIFERAQAVPCSKLVVSAPLNTTLNNGPLYITVEASSWIQHGKNKTLVAVTGTEMHSGFIKQMFDNATATKNLNCKNNDSVVCAIVDQNGYIVVSNLGDNAIGSFFGKDRGALMDHLSSPNISIFRKITLDDTQAECPVPQVYDSASNFLLNPIQLMFSLSTWLIGSCWSLLLHITVLGTSFFRKYSTNAETTIDPTNVSCTKEMNFFLFKDHLLNNSPCSENTPKTVVYKGSVECEPSIFQNYILTSVPETNLVFIIAEPNHFKCNQKPLETSSTKNKDLDSFQDQRFRVRPNECFNPTQPYEKNSEYCGAGILTKPSFFNIFCLLTFYTYQNVAMYLKGY